MSVAGVWQNEYGSRMTLSVGDSNLVVGTYVSSTGSTGTYCVIGWQAGTDAAVQSGQLVCLAIQWHSVVQGPPDNSWHWVSGLSGQIYIVNGQEQLVLAHALVASIDLPGLTPAGTYIDKLTYTRVAAGVPESIEALDLEAIESNEDPAVGSWFAAPGTMLDIMKVVPNHNNAFGWVVGQSTFCDDQLKIYGVTDIHASSSGLGRQSVAIAGLPSTGTGPAIALAGTLDLSSGAMTLLNLHSTWTHPNNSYLQTQISSLTFRKNQAVGVVGRHQRQDFLAKKKRAQ